MVTSLNKQPYVLGPLTNKLFKLVLPFLNEELLTSLLGEPE